MTQQRFSGLTDARLRDALTRQPEAGHLSEQLDLVLADAQRTRQASAVSPRLLLLAAAVVLLLAALVLAIVGSRRLSPPNGGLVALDVGWDIVLINGDGTDLRWLTRDSETEWEPAWSPAGSRLAYWLEDPLPPGGTCGVCDVHAPRRLVVSDVGAGVPQRTVLTTVSNASGWRISWSPDGRRLVVGDLENAVHVLAVIDVGTGVRTRLGSATLDGWDAAWSPDGAHIAFAHGADDPTQRSLEVIDPDGTNVRRISTIPSRGAGFSVPVWSPVAEELAFAAETTGSDPFQRDIWTVGLDGAPEVDRSNDPADEFGVNWSPDGSHLAWLRQVGPGTAPYQVVVADANGSARVLPTIVRGTPPTWSPDGTHVLAVELASGAGTDRLVSIDVRTGASTVVLDAVPDDIGTWQPAQH